MNKSPVYKQQVSVTGLSHEGRGIAHLEGKTTFIDNALPGEIVDIRYLKRHAKFDEAIAENIVTPSLNRSQPACPHFMTCGGCSLQHLSTELQLQHKQTMLLEQLQHFGQVSPSHILPPLTGPDYYYRTKARLGVKFVNKKNKLLVGFREINGRYLADLEQCEILVPQVGHKLKELAALISQLSCATAIAQIEIAAGVNKTVLIFRNLAPISQEDKQKLIEFAKAFEFVIALQPGKQDSIHSLYPENDNLELYYQIPDHNIAIFFYPTDFTQVNYQINLAMLNQALELLDLSPSEQVLDLFCGLGNFTLPIARYCQSVVGVEGCEKMVAQARLNAQRNQITNASFHVGNLFEPDKIHGAWKQTYHKLLLDPPRSGALEICETIGQFAAHKIVYVSCNPATLARDAKYIVQQGYSLSTVGIINMFPHTKHIETIALFEKK